MSTANPTTSNDTANPLMPVTKYVSGLVNAEPCTKALATPLGRTFKSLHQYLHATNAQEKIKHESDYAASSARLMTNLRTCLENLKETSRKKFDDLMTFFRTFGEKLPKIIDFLRLNEVEADLPVNMALEQTRDVHVKSLVNFPNKVELPSKISFPYLSDRKGSEIIDLEIINVPSLFKFIKAASERNKLVGRPLAEDISGKLILANLVKAALGKSNGEPVKAEEAKQGLKVTKLNLEREIEDWEKKSQPISDFETVRGVSEKKALDFNAKIQAKFGANSSITNLHLMPDYINFSREMQNLCPTTHGYCSKHLETVLKFGKTAHHLNKKSSFEGYNPRLTENARKNWNKFFQTAKA